MSYIKSSGMEQFREIEHGFGTRDTPPPDGVLLMSQRHTNNVIIVEDRRLDHLPVADAMLTNVPRLSLGVKTADCLPILVYDPEVKVIGVIHAGWRGLANMVILNTIDILCEYYHARRNNMYFSIGPGICPNCYEVGDEVFEEINGRVDMGDSFKKTTGNSGLLNLVGVAYKELVTAGIPRANLSRIDMCTKCSETLYSHRKGDAGRQISYIKLV